MSYVQAAQELGVHGSVMRCVGRAVRSIDLRQVDRHPDDSSALPNAALPAGLTRAAPSSERDRLTGCRPRP